VLQFQEGSYSSLLLWLIGGFCKSSFGSMVTESVTSAFLLTLREEARC